MFVVVPQYPDGTLGRSRFTRLGLTVLSVLCIAIAATIAWAAVFDPQQLVKSAALLGGGGIAVLVISLRRR